MLHSWPPGQSSVCVCVPLAVSGQDLCWQGQRRACPDCNGKKVCVCCCIWCCWWCRPNTLYCFHCACLFYWDLFLPPNNGRCLVLSLFFACVHLVLHACARVVWALDVVCRGDVDDLPQPTIPLYTSPRVHHVCWLSLAGHWAAVLFMCTSSDMRLDRRRRMFSG